MCRDHTTSVSREIQATLGRVEAGEVEALADLILEAKRVFVAGAGRSGLMVRAFALRLMHMGFGVHVVGDVTTPPIGEGDVLLVGSGSGETDSLVLTANKAIGSGARIGLLTAIPDSTVGKLAERVVRIPAPTPKSNRPSPGTSIQPMGSLFEQCLLIVLDSVVLLLMERKGLTGECMFGQHANLE